MKGVTGNILKRHLDQALQGGKAAQGLKLFCKLNFESKSKPGHCFSPEPIYSNSNAMFFVEEKGNKYQVMRVLTKMQILILGLHISDWFR